MKTLLRNALVFQQAGFVRRDIIFSGGAVVAIGPSLSGAGCHTSIDASNQYILPGFADVHVHLREPGFSYKETIASGALAAAAGGYTAVCAMPNISPAPDSADNLGVQLDIIRRDAHVPVLPYASITVGQKGEGQLVDFMAMAPLCFGFSDDGKGVQSEALMLEAMTRVKAAGSFIAAHCEDESLLRGGYIHDGEYAKNHGHAGICSQSEWGQIERDLALAAKTGCKYHVCHVSTKESVDLIRRAKGLGINVSCETAPHYLILCDSDLQEDGRFKMNPPLRSAADRQALIEGILDGTIDMIATDHAPHSAQEKARGLSGSAFGIVGLETAFPLLYTYLVRTGIITMEKLVDLMAVAPRRRFPGLGAVPQITAGTQDGLTVIDTAQEYQIDPDTFVSAGRATPFAGWTVRGRTIMTTLGGKCVWKAN